MSLEKKVVDYLGLCEVVFEHGIWRAGIAITKLPEEYFLPATYRKDVTLVDKPDGPDRVIAHAWIFDCVTEHGRIGGWFGILGALASGFCLRFFLARIFVACVFRTTLLVIPEDNTAVAIAGRQHLVGRIDSEAS